jgi:hypothetical protein
MSKLHNNKKVNIKGLIRLLKRRNYIVYEEPFKLNIVGVRANTTVPNKFDDLIFVFYVDEKGKWIGKAYPATTDTGTYWLKNPMNTKGSALLKEGQYVDTYSRGLHRGQYMALTQTLKPVTVYRDYDRDAVLDFNNGKEETGFFGINVHRASSKGTTKTVDKYSAGCQVFANADDYAEFMEMTKKHADLYGNKFTYTLIDERAYIRAVRRYAAYVGFGVVIIAAWVGIRTALDKKIIPKI